MISLYGNLVSCCYLSCKSFYSLCCVVCRWLWTNGKIGKDGWVPWDTEVQNAAPAVLLWRQGSTTITARIPGLYRYSHNNHIPYLHPSINPHFNCDCLFRITGAVFTSLPSALQICLNGEPILSLQPDVADTATASNAQSLREERYVRLYSPVTSDLSLMTTTEL
jgi:hypothetical protein